MAGVDQPGAVNLRARQKRPREAEGPLVDAGSGGAPTHSECGGRNVNYVPLGVRTEYSFLDGMCRIEPLVERARALRFSAVGIADLHSSYAFVPFYAAAQAAGLKPILGATVRVHADVAAQQAWGPQPAVLKLLARDAGGYRNLLRLLSRAHLECGGAEPSVGFQDLERFAAGLLALDGGLAGPVAQCLLQKETASAADLAAQLRGIFGADGFCMELQRQASPDDARTEPERVRLARQLNVPVVATADVRYLEPGEAEAHAVLECIRDGRTLVRPLAGNFSDAPHLLRSDLEMRQLFRDLPEALDNTCLVGERCQVELELGTPRAPQAPSESGRAPHDELLRVCERGALQRYGVRRYDELSAAVRDRLAHELAVIEELELASCFLIARDVMRYAREEGIFVGPGRGAAAGSLVCYAAGITALDPLVHGLLFERFVSRNAGRLPEFDFDVENASRDTLVQRVQRELGPERVAHAASINTLSTRSVVREVAHALGFENDEIDAIGRSLHADGVADLWQALDRSPALRRSYQADPRVRRLLDVARRLEGLPRIPALQAGGLLVAAGSITDQVALQRSRTGEVIAQVTHESAQALGLLRLDLAASRALGVIQTTLRLLGNRKAAGLAVETLPLDDEPTFRMLAAGDTSGVTHLDGPNVQEVLRQVEPGCFADLVAVLCLVRPGARTAGLLERFVARRHGEAEGTHVEGTLQAVLESTGGLLLYQEQLVDIAVEIAGYGRDDAEGLRGALQRRRIGDLARHRARFVRGAVERGVALEVAEEVFGTMLRFANFDFDKAHGTGTSLLAYASAYLRAHYPAEYAAAAASECGGQHAREVEVLVDVLAHGLEVLPVDVNRSAEGYGVERGAVRLGLAQVKRLESVEAQAILSERGARGRFAALGDFCERLSDLSPAALQDLARAGALDGLGLGRAQVLGLLQGSLELERRDVRAAAVTQQLELDFGSDPEPRRRAVIPEVEELTGRERAQLERETLALGVDLGSLRSTARMRRLGDLQAAPQVARTNEGAAVRVAGVLRGVREAETRRHEAMAFLRLEDVHGEFEVVVFPRAMPAGGVRLFNAEMEDEVLLVVEGHVEHRGEGTRVVATRIEVVDREMPIVAGDHRIAGAPLWEGSDRAPSALSGDLPAPHAERQAGLPASGSGGRRLASRVVLRPLQGPGRQHDGRRSRTGRGRRSQVS